MIRSTVVGNYPKLPSLKGDVNIRRLLHRFDKWEIGKEELDRAFDQVTTRVIREQIESGVDLPTDGQIRWDDIVTPFASRTEGFEIGGLIRWFDNNVYYRKPVVVSQIKWQQSATASHFRFAASGAGQSIKAVLPSPYSFARLSEDRYYHNLDRLVADLADLLHSETRSLVEAGATQIQFDEPCLQCHPEHLTLAADALNAVVKDLQAEFWLCFYFGKIDSIVPYIHRFPVKVVAVDCVSQASNFDFLMKLGEGVNPCFGLLDARNVKMEDFTLLNQKYARIAGKFPDAYISPSCGLEFLPHGYALDKIRLLGSSVRRFRGEQDNA